MNSRLTSYIALAGWIAAAAFSLPLFSARQKCADDAGSQKAAAREGASDDADRPSPDSSRSKSRIGKSASKYLCGDNGYACPGDDWSPPGDVGSIDGLAALLGNVSPGNRRLFERLVSVAGSEDSAAVFAAARACVSSNDPAIRAMAVRALRDALPRTGEDAVGRLDVLREFLSDESSYVKESAKKGISDGIVYAKKLIELGGGTVAGLVDAAVKAVKALDDDRASASLAQAFRQSLESFDSARYEETLRTLSELSKSDDDLVAAFAKKAYSAAAGENVGDEESLERNVSELSERMADAMENFPESRTIAAKFAEGAQKLKAEAESRYGSSDRAEEWLAEEREFLKRKLGRGQKDGLGNRTSVSVRPAKGFFDTPETVR
ncbi:MAG: hypothetical protein E7049_12325 [Lentisphaerae bacterium]|nr:hypothetical protein [Lentisphaerota bacterium]